MEKIKNMEKIKRDSMIIYRSVCDLIRALPAEARLETYDAMIDYGLDGVERALDGMEKAILDVAKPLIDANNRRYDKKRRAQTTSEHADADDMRQPVVEPSCERDHTPRNEQRSACVSCTNCSHAQSDSLDKGTAATPEYAEVEREPQPSFAAEVADLKKSLMKQVNTRAGKSNDADFDPGDTNTNVNKNVNEKVNKNANENANANVYYNTATSSPGRARARETHFEAPSVEEVYSDQARDGRVVFRLVAQ